MSAARLALAAVGASLLASCSFAGPHLRRLSSPRTPPSFELSFHRWQQKSVHNAYEQRESVREQLEQHNFRSVEFDVHRGKLGRAKLKEDWYVYHVDFPGLDGSSCRTLSECLGEVNAYHLRNPQHEVLTVFVDLKDDFAPPGHQPSHLDDRIAASLSPDARFGPRELLARCPGAATLREAVTGACAWPSLGELRGKVMVALTGGDTCSPEARLSKYVRGGVDAAGRAAFIAPNVSDACPFAAYDRAPHAVFFNLDHASLGHAPAIASAGLVSRAYYGGITGGLDDPGSWDDAAAAGVQFLATDRVDEARYPWTVR